MNAHRVTLLLAGCAALVGCGSFWREHAVTTATRELARRNYPLPQNYTAEAGEGAIAQEFAPTLQRTTVEFRQTDHGRRKLLYTVWFDETGRASVVDSRREATTDE